MNARFKIAYGCYVFAILTVALFGVVYSFKSEFMPYHAVAVGMPWAEVPENFQVLIIALMRAFGGSCIALAVGALVILIKEFPNNTPWARWAIPVMLSLGSLGGMYAMSHVMLNSPASPPWFASALIVLLCLVGFVLSKPKSAAH